jgi:hypothetical protein
MSESLKYVLSEGEPEEISKRGDGHIRENKKKRVFLLSDTK